MLLEEGLDNVFARHDRFAEATRRAVRAWGLQVQCAEARHYSSALTAVRVPEGHSANALRAVILERFNMSLGNGLGQLNDRVFRIGHLGDFGELSLVGALGGIEMGLRAAGVPHAPDGVAAAMNYLAGNEARSFLKKRTKKLLFTCFVDEVFLLLFVHKKKILTSWRRTARRGLAG